jgi:hypothetical protein
VSARGTQYRLLEEIPAPRDSGLLAGDFTPTREFTRPSPPSPYCHPDQVVRVTLALTSELVANWCPDCERVFYSDDWLYPFGKPRQDLVARYDDPALSPPQNRWREPSDWHRWDSDDSRVLAACVLTAVAVSCCVAGVLPLAVILLGVAAVLTVQAVARRRRATRARSPGA